MYEANTVQDAFDDHWFRQLLNTDLPQISLFNNQRQINDFLFNLARFYADSTRQNPDPKIVNEF